MKPVGFKVARVAKIAPVATTVNTNEVAVWLCIRESQVMTTGGGINWGTHFVGRFKPEAKPLQPQATVVI